MRLLELITDCTTGNLSHTKIWANIAYLSATVAFVGETIFSDQQVEPDIWLIYLGVVGGHGALSKFISMKYGVKDGN